MGQALEPLMSASECEGYGVSFPSRVLHDYCAPRKASEVQVKQVLSVHQGWRNWRQAGKELSAEELQTHLGHTPG